MTTSVTPDPPVLPPPPSRRGRTLLLVALGVVALLVLGAGTAVTVAKIVSAADETAPSPDRDGLQVAWRVPYEGTFAPSETAETHLFAGWLLADVVVRAAGDGVVAYRTADGTQAWAAPLPEGTRMCAASPTADPAGAAISFGTEATCDRLAGLDLRTGRLAWQRAVPAPVRHDRGVRTALPVVAAGGNAVVETQDGTLLAYSLADGSPRWRAAPLGRRCTPRAGMQGDGAGIVVAQLCGEGLRIASYDPAGGTRRWITVPAPFRDVTTVISASPAVVWTRERAQDAILAFDDRGRQRARIPGESSGAEIDSLPVNLGAGTVNERLAVLVTDDTLYARMTAARQVDGAEGQVAAFDLATGRSRWSSTGLRGGNVTLVRADRTGVLVLDGPTPSEPRPRLVRLPADSGRAVTVGEAPPESWQPFRGTFAYERAGALAVLPFKRSYDSDVQITLLRARS